MSFIVKAADLEPRPAASADEIYRETVVAYQRYEKITLLVNERCDLLNGRHAEPVKFFFDHSSLDAGQKQFVGAEFSEIETEAIERSPGVSERP